jgi:hypothetical protein
MEEKNNPRIITDTKRTATNILAIAAKFLFVAICSLLVAISGARAVNAATLGFSPAAGTYAVGKSFTVNVYVSSSDQAMNAASGVISFPADKLEVVSLSKSGSIFSLWVSEPAFSNQAGTANFEGIVMNPGFKGSSGKIMSISFKAKAAGAATVNFSSASILANDGKGTNILGGLGSAKFAVETPVSAPAAQESTTPPVTAGAPPAPQILSETHADPNKWYSASTAKFSWVLPAGTTAARILVSELPQATPIVNYTPAISSKEIAGLSDGVWYLHVQLRNNYGWGAISHFRFQIDTKPPEPFSIKVIDGKETENPRPTIVFETTDSLSGIDYYKVKVSENDFITLSTDGMEHNPHTLAPQKPGKRTILVQAFDKAGNYTTASEEIVIKPLKSPVFTDYPEELRAGEPLVIRGKTDYPEAQVVVWLQKENEEAKSQIVKNDQEGKFVYIAEEKLNDGIYRVWAEVIDSRGARSGFSEKAVIAVKPPAYEKAGKRAINFLAVIIPLASLCIVLIFLLWHSWHKFLLFKRKLRKEINVMGKYFHKSFAYLKEDTEKHIKMLERTKSRRELTKEEEKILKRLKDNLDSIERTVSKEIEEIEDDVK